MADFVDLMKVMSRYIEITKSWSMVLTNRKKSLSMQDKINLGCNWNNVEHKSIKKNVWYRRRSLLNKDIFVFDLWSKDIA